jgi:hypothetical protein
MLSLVMVLSGCSITPFVQDTLQARKASNAKQDALDELINTYGHPTVHTKAFSVMMGGKTRDIITQTYHFKVDDDHTVVVHKQNGLVEYIDTIVH